MHEAKPWSPYAIFGVLVMANELTSPRFLEGGWHISYLIWHATGEGVRVCVAVAGSQADAEKTLRSKIEEDFYPAIKSSPITDDSNDEVMRLLQWIPDAVKETLKQVPLGMGEYYAELFYDLG